MKPSDWAFAFLAVFIIIAAVVNSDFILIAIILAAIIVLRLEDVWWKKRQHRKAKQRFQLFGWSIVDTSVEPGSALSHTKEPHSHDSYFDGKLGGPAIHWHDGGHTQHEHRQL